VEGATRVATMAGVIEAGANHKFNVMLYVCKNVHDFKHKPLYTL